MRIVKVFITPFFAVTWFSLMCLGVVVLILPQLTVNAYGFHKDYIGAFIDFMDAIFEHFAEEM